MSRHLIDVRKRLVKCQQCRQRIWHAYDGGMPVYADLDPVDPLTEILARLDGKLTFVEIGSYLALRNRYNVGTGGAVHIQHPHRNGIIEIERTPECPTATNNAATDSSVPY